MNSKNDGQTEAYNYLKPVARRLQLRFGSVEHLTGRCSEKLRDVVARQCAQAWEDAVKNALDTGFPGEDVRAAWCRLEDGKSFLTFLKTATPIPLAA